MAAPGSGDSDLSKHLERIDSKIDQLEAATSRTKMIGRLMTFVIAAAAVLMVLLVLQPFWKAYQNQKAYQDAFAKQLEQRLAPLARSEAELLTKEVLPAYQRAVENVINNRQTEVFAKLDGEMVAFQNNVSDGLIAEMVAFQDRLIAKQHARLVAEFPQLADQENAEEVVGRLQEVSQNVSKRIVDDLFAVHFQAMMDLEMTFKGFRVPDEVRNMSDQELGQHVTDLVMELLSAKFNLDASELSVPTPVR